MMEPSLTAAFHFVMTVCSLVLLSFIFNPPELLSEFCIKSKPLTHESCERGVPISNILPCSPHKYVALFRSCTLTSGLENMGSEDMGPRIPELIGLTAH